MTLIQQIYKIPLQDNKMIQGKWVNPLPNSREENLQESPFKKVKRTSRNKNRKFINKRVYCMIKSLSRRFKRKKNSRKLKKIS